MNVYQVILFQIFEDVFIRDILKVPGLRIESGPDIICNDTVEGYEVNNLILAVD